ncbi:hypothetical protein Golob_007276, partial [Gossypium lobatum]|nr:hypothetical protein [Gossypium lobatum]
MAGYRQVEIESDNSVLIVVIQNGLVANNCYTKVRLIQDWCFEDWESNRLSDCITKEARGEMEQLIIHQEPP